MNRRDLVKDAARLAGSGVVSRAILPTFGLDQAIAGALDGDSKPPSGHPALTRQAPANPIALRSGALEVTFDSQDGLPYSYKFRAQRLGGEDEGQPARAVICQLAPRDYRTVPAQLISTKRFGPSLTFEYRANFAGVPAAAFSIRYVIDESSLIVTMEAVKEHEGFELIELALPQLMSVREEDGPAWMAEGRRGGSFVNLESAKSYRFPDNPYFGRISTELPVGLVGRAGIGCLMEVTAYQDGTETEIKGAPGRHHASIGCVMSHRVHGGRCYNMNDGATPICGNSQTLNLIVGQTPKTRFDFFSCEGQAQPWLTGAKIMRARMPAAPTQYFSDKLLYIVAGKRKIDTEPKSTFAQSAALVRDVAMLTDYAPQVVFISGFAYDGQDTGFPSEDKINSTLGTDTELRELIQSGKRINANVTLNVNYDDAYKSSPVFDEAFIARRPDGAIWKSRAWDGEDSYVVGMAKFMQGGWGSKRIAFTTDHFKIKDAILIDAMSWFAVRDDWDPRHPASGYKNLLDGKYKILEEFQKRGVAVTSEQLRYPFIGKLAQSMDGPGISDCPFGGEAVPLLATVYRGSAIWGTGDGSVRPQRELFWNTRSALWFQADSTLTRMTDFYFLISLPFSKLHRIPVENYESFGSLRRLRLEKNSQITMDTSTQEYSATLDGVEIARNDATFCAIDEHRIAFYALTARQLRYPMPTNWRTSAVRARTLTVNGGLSANMRLGDGMIVIDAEAQKPVIVYSSEDAIPSAS